MQGAQQGQGRQGRNQPSADPEAAAIADRCWHAFTGGTPWRDMAVLFRTNAQSVRFEHALARRSVPFCTVAGGRRFAEQPAVRMLLDRMHETATPGRSFLDVRGVLGRVGEVSDAPETWASAALPSVRWAGAWTLKGEVAMPAPMFVENVPTAAT